MKKRLSRKNALYTPGSGTTVLVNYSEQHEILEVEFVGGRVYHYHNVEPEIWKEYKSVIESGGSSGKFVNTRVKDDYEYTPITN